MALRQVVHSELVVVTQILIPAQEIETPEEIGAELIGEVSPAPYAKCPADCGLGRANLCVGHGLRRRPWRSEWAF